MEPLLSSPSLMICHRSCFHSRCRCCSILSIYRFDPFSFGRTPSSFVFRMPSLLVFPIRRFLLCSSFYSCSSFSLPLPFALVVISCFFFFFFWLHAQLDHYYQKYILSTTYFPTPYAPIGGIFAQLGGTSSGS